MSCKPDCHFTSCGCSMCLPISTRKPVLPIKHDLPIPLIWAPKVFAVDSVYQSRNIHLPSSVHVPDDSSLRACQGPGLIFEGFVWFLVFNFMSVSMKMEDSCQWRGICLCHSLPSPTLSYLSVASSLPLSFLLLFCLLSASFFFNPQTLKTP